LRSLYELAGAAGANVLLSGVGAHTWLGGSDYPYLGLVREGKFGVAASTLGVASREVGRKRAVTFMLRSLIWPQIRRYIPRRLASSRVGPHRLEFLAPESVRRIGLHERFRESDNAEDYDDLAQWGVTRHATSGFAAYYRESEDRTDSRCGIEERHPLW